MGEGCGMWGVLICYSNSKESKVGVLLDLCWSDTMWILVEMGLMRMSKRLLDLWAWTPEA